jgi:hypothetical protein
MKIMEPQATSQIRMVCLTFSKRSVKLRLLEQAFGFIVEFFGEMHVVTFVKGMNDMNYTIALPAS